MFAIIYNKEDGRILDILGMPFDIANIKDAIPETADVIEVSELPIVNSPYREKLVVNNNKLEKIVLQLTPQQEQEVVNIESQQEIDALKFELKETDYYTLKYMEGALSEEMFKEKCAYRQTLRDRIKELESKIVYPKV